MRRFTARQHQVLGAEGVRLVGVDARGRPVVEQRRLITGKLERWALTRAGDPADVTEPVTEPPGRPR